MSQVTFSNQTESALGHDISLSFFVTLAASHTCRKTNAATCRPNLFGLVTYRISPVTSPQTVRTGHYRRNNRKDRGRLVPQLLGWGTNNVLIPQLDGRSFQKAKNFTASSHQNVGYSIWVFKYFPGVIHPGPHSGRGATPFGRARDARCWDPNLGPRQLSAVVAPMPVTSSKCMLKCCTSSAPSRNSEMTRPHQSHRVIVPVTCWRRSSTHCPFYWLKRRRRKHAPSNWHSFIDVLGVASVQKPFFSNAGLLRPRPAIPAGYCSWTWRWNYRRIYALAGLLAQDEQQEQERDATHRSRGEQYVYTILLSKVTMTVIASISTAITFWRQK